MVIVVLLFRRLNVFFFLVVILSEMMSSHYKERHKCCFVGIGTGTVFSTLLTLECGYWAFGLMFVYT